MDIYLFTYLVDPSTYSTIITRQELADSTIITRQELADSNVEISLRNQTSLRTNIKDKYQKIIEERFPNLFCII